MKIPFFLAFVLGALVLAGCTAPAETTTTAQASTTLAETSTTLAQTTTTLSDTTTTVGDTTSSTLETTTTLKQGETKEFTVQASNWDFTPSTIEVNEGDHVILHVTSTDVGHGLALPKFGVDVKVGPGETKTVEFDATEKGEFTFFCNVFCGAGHQQMRGMLVVK